MLREALRKQVLSFIAGVGGERDTEQYKPLCKGIYPQLAKLHMHSRSESAIPDL